jgi:hypothetical protein
MQQKPACSAGLPPVVSKLAPAKGSVASGKKVKITGLNFENPTVTSVSFGKLSAKEFTVTLPTSVTAVSPASATTGVVEVKLTTSAGTNASTTTDQFTYETNRPDAAVQRSYARAPTASRYSCSKRASSGVPRFHSSQKASTASSNSTSRPL